MAVNKTSAYAHRIAKAEKKIFQIVLMAERVSIGILGILEIAGVEVIREKNSGLPRAKPAFRIPQAAEMLPDARASDAASIPAPTVDLPMPAAATTNAGTRRTADK